MKNNQVVELKPWEVVVFPWGSAVKTRKGKWTHLFIGEQEVKVDHLDVILHENGIEFVNQGGEGCKS